MTTKLQEALRRFVDAEHDKPCKHGHLDCSNVTHGRCLDETLATYPELEEEQRDSICGMPRKDCYCLPSS